MPTNYDEETEGGGGMGSGGGGDGRTAPGRTQKRKGGNKPPRPYLYIIGSGGRGGHAKAGDNIGE